MEDMENNDTRLKWVVYYTDDLDVIDVCHSKTWADFVYRAKKLSAFNDDVAVEPITTDTIEAWKMWKLLSKK